MNESQLQYLSNYASASTIASTIKERIKSKALAALANVRSRIPVWFQFLVSIIAMCFYPIRATAAVLGKLMNEAAKNMSISAVVRTPIIKIPVVLTTEVTIDRLVEEFLHFLHVNVATLMLVAVLFQLLLVSTFLLMIKSDVREISSMLRSTLGFNHLNLKRFFAFLIFLILLLTLLARLA